MEDPRFIQMVNDSLGYSACLYHNINDYSRGQLYPVERQLASRKCYTQILALRLLFAAISEPVPDLKYEVMLQSIPDLAERITLNDVLCFFHEAVKTTHDRPILVSLFLDEINWAESVGATTWVQEIISSYVHSLHDSRVTNVLLVVSASYTQHQAASLALTSSRLTPHVPVPVFTLNLEDSMKVVTTFFERLSATLGYGGRFLANDDLQLCVELTGGMPRYLGFMIRGMVTGVGTDPIHASTLLTTAQTFGPSILNATLKNIIRLASWHPQKYREGVGFNLLLEALRHSLLATTVYRSRQVALYLPISAEHSWDHLEQRGLVSLQVLSSDPVVQPQDWPCRVYFPPLLALALQDMRPDYFGTCFPSPTERGFRGRELSDLKFIAFMIFLLKPTAPATSRLQDIIPRAWDMRKELQILVLPYPDSGRLDQVMTRERVTGAALQRLQVLLGKSFSLLSCGTFGLDSAHVLGDYLIITQTRSSYDAEKQPISTASMIFWSCFFDLTGVVRLSHLSCKQMEDEFGSPPEGLRKQVQELFRS